MENINVAISLYPHKSSVPHNNKAVTLNNLGRYLEAIETLELGLQAVNHNNVSLSYAYCNIGTNKFALGNIEEAKINYDKSLESKQS